jgi:hypothetical protein
MVIAENETALALINPARFRKITIETLNELGYELTGSAISMDSNSPPKYSIMEVRNEGEKKSTVTFSYLFSLEDSTGVILEHGYSYYYRKSRKAK